MFKEAYPTREDAFQRRPAESYRRQSRRCALDVAFPYPQKLTNPIDLPPCSPNVETLVTSKHRPPFGCGFAPFRSLLWMPAGTSCPTPSVTTFPRIFPTCLEKSRKCLSERDTATIATHSVFGSDALKDPWSECLPNRWPNIKKGHSGVSCMFIYTVTQPVRAFPRSPEKGTLDITS